MNPAIQRAFDAIADQVDKFLWGAVAIGIVYFGKKTGTIDLVSPIVGICIYKMRGGASEKPDVVQKP